MSDTGEFGSLGTRGAQGRGDGALAWAFGPQPPRGRLHRKLRTAEYSIVIFARVLLVSGREGGGGGGGRIQRLTRFCW